jgi:SAM-dependent methyltransferase
MDDDYETSVSARDKRVDYARHSPVTERSWRSYPYIFNLPSSNNLEYWMDKKILDVGSGDKFDDSEFTFPGAVVHAIDPELQPTGKFSRIKYNTAHKQRLGVVQETPYDDNLFDLVLSSHAVPQHIYPVDKPKAVSEMIRVMKPNGKIKLAPCVERDLKVDELRNAGFEVDFSQPTVEGRLAVIKLPNEQLEGKSELEKLKFKVEAWKKYHEAAVPKDPVREDFDSEEYARSYLEEKGASV